MSDILKTNRQIFYEYVTQNAQVLEKLDDSDLKAYQEKQKSTPYTENGEIKVLFPNTQENSQINTSMTYTGSVDRANDYDYKNIKLNYSDTESTQFEYIQKQDQYGIKINEILNKFVTIENNNLKQWAERLGLGEEIINVIPNKLSMQADILKGLFDEETKSKYQNLITEKLTEDMFSSQENSGSKIYTLTITEGQLKSIVDNIIENLKQDEILINKIKSIMINNLGVSEEEANSYIEQIINKIQQTTSEENNETFSETIEPNQEDILSTTPVQGENSLTINIYVQEEQLQKTEINADNLKTSIIPTDNGITIEYANNDTTGASQTTTQTISIEKTKGNDEISYDIDLQDDEKNVSVKKTIKGISTLDVVEENNQYTFVSSNQQTENSEEPAIGSADIEDETRRTLYTCKKTFVDNLTQQNITEQDISLINNYNMETLVNVLGQIIARFNIVNTNHMAVAGIPEDKAVLKYYILSFIDMVYLNGFGTANTIASSDVTSMLDSTNSNSDFNVYDNSSEPETVQSDM